MSPRAFVGTSGWRYPSWRGDFYPAGLRQRDELAYLAGRLNTVELNGSFYSLQSPASYRRWHDETPPGFVFGVKGGRYLTHMLRLKGIDQAMANFFASGVLLLGDKLGPLLWQLPERLEFDAELLERFCARLPTTFGQAAEIARGHDAKVKRVEIPSGKTAGQQGQRLLHALEPRHPSFADARAADILRRHGIALVLADSAGRFPVFDEQTADFVYARLHGGEELYTSGYDEASLRAWAARMLRQARQGGAERDIYVYFDNDAKGYAPHDAEAMASLLAAAGEHRVEPVDGTQSTTE
ncbi:DUF72 domain-containing protein [Humibacter sp.]|jgi:uncharacterized protein YecE (DUF72 family)|uniref:DUF72 domain-containing protein n=1 Tax=Humibacter sp. TaxID=1940291 RepID=UPI002D1373AE|nr:DUF72 domain-containing protein [Humibacter sp.]HVX07792.1 DUF72 domain-containing protein [Humibacter sp.]